MLFDIGAAELLVIIIVAVLVIGPKDMPLAMRTAGRWIGKVRKVSAHFRTGIDAMVREAELEEMEKKWKAQNEEIMRRSSITSEAEHGEPMMTGPSPASAEAAIAEPASDQRGSADAPPPNIPSATKTAPEKPVGPDGV